MKVKVLNESNEALLLDITGSNFETVNSIRRSCINSVPVMAIEDVSIFTNNSALYDEVLAHRLGLIPLVTDLKSYVKKSECKCAGAGCARCTVQMTLEAKGPATVYSRELVSSDKAVKPVFDDMPIVKLFEGQEIKLNAVAQLGTSEQHAKFAPCFATHTFYPKLSIDQAKASKKSQEIIETCPRQVFKKEDGKVEIDKNKMLDCNLCLACQEKFPEIVTVESSDDNILLYVESWGQMPAKNVFNVSLQILSDKLGDFAKQLK